MKFLDCEAEYVGKTTQHIKERIYQQKMLKGDQHRLNKSNITKHALKLRRKINWQNYSVLARASNDYYLKIKEVLLIKERMQIINNNEGEQKINNYFKLKDKTSN